MFDLEEELVIGSERVPWVMWIQLLVMLLLLILLYHLLAFSLGLDLSPNSSAAAPPETASSSSAAASSSWFHAPKVRGIQSVENATGTSTSRRRGSKEDIHEKEGDSSQFTVFERSYHPCHYLGLARQAFLKCFGLDFTSKDSPSDTRQRKDQ